MFLCGCDIFTLRDADPPTPPPPWHNFYTRWQDTLDNMKYGYDDKRNMVKYSDLFMTNFRFYFAPQDVNDFSITGVWGRNNERDMLYSLNNWADSVRIAELSPIATQEDDTLSIPIRIYRKYTIIAKHNSETRTYAGKMELQMVQDNGFWRILNWYDYRTSTPPILPTWGKLKYDFSS
jgi:hypothetical protein